MHSCNCYAVDASFDYSLNIATANLSLEDFKIAIVQQVHDIFKHYSGIINSFKIYQIFQCFDCLAFNCIISFSKQRSQSWCHDIQTLLDRNAFYSYWCFASLIQDSYEQCEIAFN